MEEKSKDFSDVIAPLCVIVGSRPFIEWFNPNFGYAIVPRSKEAPSHSQWKTSRSLEK